MIIDLTEEETEFLLRICTRAKLFADMHIFKSNSLVDAVGDLNKINSLIEKLKKVKNDN
jgi:hypothetical protein